MRGENVASLRAVVIPSFVVNDVVHLCYAHRSPQCPKFRRSNEMNISKPIRRWKLISYNPSKKISIRCKQPCQHGVLCIAFCCFYFYQSRMLGAYNIPRHCKMGSYIMLRYQIFSLAYSCNFRLPRWWQRHRSLPNK